MRIHKLFNGTHIDLDHVLMITPAYFDDRMGSGGYFVGFGIQFMFKDEMTNFWFEGHGIDPRYNDRAKAKLFEIHGDDYPVQPKEIEYASRAHRIWAEKHMTAWLQKRVDGLIEVWRRSP